MVTGMKKNIANFAIEPKEIGFFNSVKINDIALR